MLPAEQSSPKPSSSSEPISLGHNGYVKLFLNRDLSSLREEPLRLQSKINDLSKSKLQTLSQHYEIIIDSQKTLQETSPEIAELNKEIKTEFQESVNHLDQELLDFKSKWSQLSENKKRLDTIRSHANYLQDLCDLPKLLVALISNRDYKGALELVHRVRELSLQFNKNFDNHSLNDSFDLLKFVKTETEAGLEKMVFDLINNLKSKSLKLPDCLRYINFLSQTKWFTTEHLKIILLNCRLSSFEAALNSDEKSNRVSKTGSSEDRGRILKRMLDSTLAFSTEMFSFYRAAFPSSAEAFERETTTLTLDSLLDESSRGFLNSLLHSKIVSPLITKLKTDLPFITQTNILSSLLNQFMFTSASLNRVGLDIRQLLAPTFEDCILGAFSSHFKKATEDFKHSLNPSSHRTRQFFTSLSEKITEETFTSPETSIEYLFQCLIEHDFTPTSQLSLFPPLAQYLNDILHQFNSLRTLAVLNLANPLLRVLLDNLKEVALHLLSVVPLNDSTKKDSSKSPSISIQRAWTYVTQNLYLNTLLPYLGSVMILGIFGGIHVFLPLENSKSKTESLELLLELNAFRSLFPEP